MRAHPDLTTDRSPLIGVVRLASAATDAVERGFVDVALDQADIEIFDVATPVAVAEQVQALDRSGWYDRVVVLPAGSEQAGRDLANACLSPANAPDRARYQPVGAAH
ncbi:MAG: hypothetical protein AAF467_08175 [Actinomycetota bacterium]